MATLACFIRSEMESILSDWERFAGTLTPATTGLDRVALRDSAEEILSAIADDMETSQTVAEQADKSKGLRDGTSDVMLTATLHAGDRLAGMFTLNQLVADSAHTPTCHGCAARR